MQVARVGDRQRAGLSQGGRFRRVPMERVRHLERDTVRCNRRRVCGLAMGGILNRQRVRLGEHKVVGHVPMQAIRNLKRRHRRQRDAIYSVSVARILNRKRVRLRQGYVVSRVGVRRALDDESDALAFPKAVFPQTGLPQATGPESHG